MVVILDNTMILVYYVSVFRSKEHQKLARIIVVFRLSVLCSLDFNFLARFSSVHSLFCLSLREWACMSVMDATGTLLTLCLCSFETDE